MIARALDYVAILLACAGVASAAPIYHLTDLGTFGGTNSYAYGINGSSQVVGYTYSVGHSQQAFLYSNHTLIDLGAVLGSGSSYAYGINNSGQIGRSVSILDAGL